MCSDCGRTLPPSAAGSGNKRCRPCARVWREAARCVTCGVDLSGRRARKYCSKRCCSVDLGTALLVRLEPTVCALAECDVTFVPNKGGQRCCSELHGKRLWNRENPGEWGDRRRDNYHRRRALKAQTTTGRPVVLSLIRERDADRCHICREDVPDVAWPDPLSPSLDHVVPLSRGGTHDPDNVRLAHLRCNVEKGDQLLA